MTNVSYSDFILFTGNSIPSLAEDIAERLGKRLGKADVGKFSDGEISVSLNESVRGKDCFVMQSISPPINASLMELLIMIDAMKRASAGRINAVIPYFGYARQDRKAKPRDPVTARLIADLLTVAGAERVITMDLHADQIQGFFNYPVDQLFGSKLILNYLKKRKLKEPVFVSPDHGSVKRTRYLANKLGCPIAIVDKRREKANVSEVMNIIGDVKGKNAVMIDDMIDTAGTISNAADAIKKMGAAHVYACATHGVLSGEAIDRLEKSAIEELVLLNTIPIPKEKKLKKMEILNVAGIFAEAIESVYHSRSVSKIFD
jgi:ribose-phosphate pyrophosphokinase